MRLHINIDHVATLRNQRDTAYPDIVQAAELCLGAGAVGITVHLREDRRHIRDQDVLRLRARFPRGSSELDTLNLEMAATPEMAEIAAKIGPDMVTLVPERREERTTEGGLSVAHPERLAPVIQRCREAGIKVSLFIEAKLADVEASARLGATQVEFHTGHYCDSPAAEQPGFLPGFRAACERAHELGLEVAAGHGLNCENVGPIVALPHMAELNIGHSVICEAVFLGLPGAVRRLAGAIAEAGQRS